MSNIPLIILSRAQRKAAYEYVLANLLYMQSWFKKMQSFSEHDQSFYCICPDLINFYTTSICHLKPSDAVVNSLLYRQIISQFEEFLTFKPVGKAIGDRWFDSIDERISVMQKCVEMCS